MNNGYSQMAAADLVPAAYNPNTMGEEQFAQLVTEVNRAWRVLKPVVIRRADGGRFVIVDGEHNWRAAKAAGLEMVPVEVVEVDDFEARRQSFTRNRHGQMHPVRLGRMWLDMMSMGGGMSTRELAAALGVSQGTVCNMLLYVKLAEMPGAPGEDAVAKMSVREVRKLIASLQGADAEPEPEQEELPATPPPEPAELKALKRAWNKAPEPARAAFIEWVGIVQPVIEKPASAPDTAVAAAQPEPASRHSSDDWFTLVDDICTAAGGSRTATAIKVAAGLSLDEKALCQLFLGHDPADCGLGDADFDQLQSNWRAVFPSEPKPKPNNGYSAPEPTKPKRGRKANPPAVVIPELEALLDAGWTYAMVGGALKVHATTPKLWRSGKSKPRPDTLASLRKLAP